MSNDVFPFVPNKTADPMWELSSMSNFLKPLSLCDIKVLLVFKAIKSSLLIQIE